MKGLGLGESHNSFYFWPALVFLTIAAAFAGWALALAASNWVGQALWAVLALVIGLLLLWTAARESRRVLLRA